MNYDLKKDNAFVRKMAREFDKNLRMCPFCGGEAELHYGHTYGFEHRYEPMCTHCYCTTGTYDKEEDAIAAWNRRVNDETEN